jgi:hypothetical protein
MRRIARQAALHRQERLAAQNDRVPEEQPVLLTEIPELGLVEPRGEGQRSLLSGRRGAPRAG